MDETKTASALLAVAASAALSCLAYLYKTRAETVKSVKRVLYFLLEMQHALAQRYFDPEELTEELARLVLQRLAELSKGDRPTPLSDEIRQVLLHHINSLGESFRTDFNDELIKQLNDALLQLAQTHPVLAFRVRGLDKVEKAFMTTDTYYRNVAIKETEAIPHEAVSKSLRQFSGDLRTSVLEDAINTLEEAILRVAWTSGPWDWLRCQYILREQRKSRHNRSLDPAFVNQLVDEMIETIQQALGSNAVTAEPARDN